MGNVKNKRIINIEDLFELANGCGTLASKLGVHQVTVEYMRKHGIPIKYWDKLYELYGLTPAELYSITKKCKARIATK